MPDPKPTPLPDPTAAVPPTSQPSATNTGSDTLGGTAAGTTVPAHIGEYVVRGELGRGGMGVVYRALDPHLKREVALKVMLPQFAANPRAKARFVREARAQARVDHDHVAAIHHVAEHHGLPYLVMPLLKGLTLQTALKANARPPLPEVIRLGREIAEGLAAAHERGLVHRDIKPANVWLEGKKLRVKVLDFGLARDIDDDGTAGEEGPVTREGVVVGTPAYMSPEQAAGRPIDERTDLWSLGVVLYQMTTGELPFRGVTAIATLIAVSTDTPPAPAERNPAVPRELSDLVMRLMAKGRDARPPSAEAVSDELRAIELALSGTARVIPLDAPPVIVAEGGPDPFAELDATEASPSPEAAPEPASAPAPRRSARTRRSKPDGTHVWAVAAGVILAVAGVVWFVAQKLDRKPPELAKEEPPPKKEYPPVKPKDKLPASERADREAIEALHPHVGLTVRLAPDRDVRVEPKDALPAEPFELIEIRKSNDGAALPPAFTALALKALARQKSFAGFSDGYLHARWTENDFAALADLPTRETLTHFTTGLDLTPKTVELLKRFPRLTNVGGLNAGAADDATLAGFAALRRVEGGGLNVRGLGESGKVTAKGWAALTGLPVSELVLWKPKGPDREACELIARMPALTALRVEGGQFDADALQALAACPKLGALYLPDTTLPAGAAKHFAAFPALRTLALTRTPVADDDVPHLAALKGLHSLDLTQTKLDKPEVLEKLNAALPRCSIGSTGKVYEPSDPHFREAARLLARGGFALTLKLPDGKDIQAKQPADLPDGPFVLTGITRDGEFGDEDLRRLEPVAGLTLLRVPGAGSGLTDAGLRSVRNHSKTLTGLSISMSGVTDEGLKNVADLNGLQLLDIDRNRVTDAGLERLKGLSELRALRVYSTDITDIGLKHLAGLKLTLLALDNTQVSDAGVEVLAGMKSLEDLSLKGTRVTEAGLKKLRAALPGCKIDWEDPHRYFARYFLDRSPHAPGTGGFEFDLKLPDSKVVKVGKSADLPAGPFTLAGLTRHGPTAPVFTDADLARLEATPTLLWFSAPGLGIGEAGLRSLLASKKTLTNLYLAGSVLTDDHLKVIAGFTELDSLHVGAVGSKITDAGIAHLAGPTKLRGLILHDTGITDAGLKHLAGLPALTGLDLTNTAVSDAGVETLAGMKGLKELGLKGTRVTKEGYEKLTKALPGCKIDWENANRTIAAWLLSQPGFKLTLVLADGMGVQAEKPEQLPAGPFTVREVRKDAEGFTDGDLRRLAVLPGLDALTLYGGGQLTDDGLESLKRFPALTRLTLQLHRGITDRGVAHLRDSTQFRAINLQHTGVGDAGLAHLAGNRDLEHLVLGGPKVTEAGLETIAGFKKLQQLNLSGVPITSQGLAKLADLTDLAHLDLAGTRIDDAGLDHLRGMKQLNHLVVGGTGVTDAGLARVAELKSLRTLDLRGAKVSEPGVKKLAEALPQCRIESDGGVIEPAKKP